MKRLLLEQLIQDQLYLACHNLVTFGTKLTIEQGTKLQRPSRLFFTPYENNKIAVEGSAVTVFYGRLNKNCHI
ncbi:hypothetical protein CDO51_02085 [Natranaerobius trueperi]|uniref:Uncharacterized protein n=2 Tax=Natranaerobius trueperi TaxID=759412 RepID=A0A226C0J8_9FIRM|nr:hypothetical protein CDO51_02085 [Natranaerobius trueperi]